MSNTIFRVHPSINFARVGNSEQYYIAPETAAGELIDKAKGLFGGLPIKPGTEDTPINEDDFRDDQHRVKRQAARFRIFAYDQLQTTYPSNDPGREVQIGDTIAGKVIKDIRWSVHLANKKNNWYKITNAAGEEEGIKSYESIDGKFNYPPIRDPNVAGSNDLNNETRRTQLVIDAGPRVICSSTPSCTVIPFSRKSISEYIDTDGSPCLAPNYPVSYPDDHLKMNNLYGPIDTLGELQIEDNTGRLIVTGGYGRASANLHNDQEPTLEDPIDNNYWFDDTSDGPVNAIIVFEDGSTSTVVAGWVVTTDPGYAPQTRNVVSTWDDIFNAWVQKLDLIPEMYKDGKFNPNYTNTSWESDVLSVFHGAFLQRWNTNLPDAGVHGHNHMVEINYSKNPSKQIPNFKALIRDPNNPDDGDNGVKMPLALGDAMKSFLSLSETQYFQLMQWYDGKSVEAATTLGKGEKLDKVVLENCLGGRYSPGIDLTFIVRDENLYKQNWQGINGPFRINEQPLDYSTAVLTKPFLEVGYIPLQQAMVEPGDLCKFMSQPWHTDYNSCAVHNPDPNPRSNNTLYWSWPAQRPVQVYPKFLCSYDSDSNVWNLGGQLFSVRGDGEGADNLCHTDLPQNVGKYQEYINYVKNWHKVGFIIQGVQVPDADRPGGHYGADKFIEVASQYNEDNYGDVVETWPTATIPTKT
jgi:hypothetical protein